MFSSPNTSEKNSKFILSKRAIRNFIKLSHDSKLDTLVISGGGEPLLELQKVIKVIKYSHYKNLEIITSGYWASNDTQIEKILGTVQKAISFKNRANSKKTDFSFRISIDKFHQKKVKLIWFKNLIKILAKDKGLPINKRVYPDIKIYFRTLLIKDKTADKFATLLKGKITKIDHLIRTIYLPNSKFKFKVFYKDMRFVGKAKKLKEKKLMSFNKYLSKYCDRNKDIRLGMTYLGPNSKGAILNGVNVFITFEGKMLPYGGTPDVYLQLDEKFSYKDFLKKIFQDIISRDLLEKGLVSIKKVAQEVKPNIDKKIVKKNWLASIADESLATPEIRLYITIRLIQKYLKHGFIARKIIPNHLNKIISIEPKDLANKYKNYIKNKKALKYNFANENINSMFIVTRRRN